MGNYSLEDGILYIISKPFCKKKSLRTVKTCTKMISD